MVNPNLKWQLLPLLIFFSTVLLSAQQPVEERPVYRFRHLHVDLNNNRVESLIQDSYGYIWIGTLGGLHRYDGVEARVYLSDDDQSSLPGDRIVRMFEDSRKRLWIGTERGICYYSREYDNFVRVGLLQDHVGQKDTTPNKITDIIEDSSGTIWIGNERSGLHYLDEGKNTFLSYNTTHPVLKDAHVMALFYDNNVMWVGTSNAGLLKLDLSSNDVTQFKHNPADTHSLASDYVEDVLIDRNNVMWIATREYGLDRCDLSETRLLFGHYRHEQNNPESLFNDDVTTVYEDNTGRIWVCNENGGLHLYNAARDSFFRYTPDVSNPFSLSNISVKVIYEDRQGRLWVGSNLEGVDVADRYEFRFDHYYQSDNVNSINNNIIRSFLEDEDGNLWIATDGGGMNRLDRKTGTFRAYKHDPNNPNSISANATLTLCTGPDGKIWIGTWRGGINVFDPGRQTFTVFRPEDNVLSKVFFLMRDSHDNIWAGTQGGGVSKYDWKEKKLHNYRNNPGNPASVSDNDIPVLLEDSRGYIWVGTEFNGLCLVTATDEGTGFRRFSHIANDAASLPANMVNHIFEDSKKNIWIATEGGLSKLDRDKFTFRNYTMDDGLPSDHIESIAEDDHGILWMGTAKGISRFDPVEETFRNYTYNDGLQRGEFSRYCVYKTRAGELIFGGTNGFNIFHPDSIHDNPYYPEVYIVGLKIFNRPVQIDRERGVLEKHISETREITLTYKESVFSFDFVALNYTHSHMNQYAYKMEGFEDHWNEVGNQRTATYTSLDPGEYTFRVIASNNDGLWNEEGASIRVIITPPFWHTAWFKFLGAFLLVMGVYFVVYYRVRQLRQTNTELEEKVNERTVQLKNLVEELRDKQDEIETINDQLDRRVQERTARLVKANEQLDRFVYSASHDLSAPLKSILGLIHIAKMEQRMDTLQQYLDHMEGSVTKLENVIFHLSQFSRNLSPVTQSEFAFKDIVDEVLQDIRYYTSISNLKIVKNYCDKDMLTSDFLRLKIILTNLISNAIKYRDREKEETRITIGFKGGENTSVIEVEDNGIGIEPKYQEKVFDMFFRGTTKSEGSGLGLFIVKDTVEKLAGHIDLKCEPGIKTSFKITLPQ